MNKKVSCIIGTRPEVIKMAPVIRALKAAGHFEVSTLSSGQHRELIAPLVDWFELDINADLSVMTENQSLSGLTARLMEGFDRYLSETRPDLVLAQGDTTTVFCAALACFYRHIPFGHVEAGLRTHNIHNPFPEEFNRVAVGRISQLHFCPTQLSRENIVSEYPPNGNSTYLTGNTVIDALQYTVAKLKNHPTADMDHDILLTAHRRESFGEPLAEIFSAVLELCQKFPDIKILYPVHPNPNVHAVAHRMLGNQPNIKLSSPLDYPELVAAMQRAKVILTDSGGIQEEAPALCKPVLVLRETTERPEAVEIGVAKLIGAHRESILTETCRLLTDTNHYQKMSQGGSPYGDGQAATRICTAVNEYLRIT
ncbi:MAG: UDP-N-acetylglucosamine 2-epimerase (non-hydrolyzing) [Proteobacteria bacterium]|nr:UDP-N-acetylglucosamine 2-epimerase (non-hydrolyzing) [Pseudomonadota bacterium]HQR03438.1 UDP-N-acetylglucosamine 2-epimerase (non-hydrolyzing) [Rhodocyclaceae bacterium]